VTKGEYPYPADEFDAVERGSVPRGVHRATRTVWRRIWPFLLVLLLFPALAYGAVGYWSTARNATQVAAPVSTSSGSPDATPGATPDAPVSQTPTEPAAPPVDPTATADLKTPVVVFNSTSTRGLAAKAATVLTAAGWTTVTAKNYTGGSVTASVVRYGSSDLQATAAAAGAALGITTVTLDATVSDLEVVLAEDYVP